MKIKRYLVFASDFYYPAGGWGNFQGAFETKQEAEIAEKEADKKFDYTEIVDLVEKGIVSDE